ncbi:uncharacterized protein LOC114580718 [Dendrobium catenatum]|uniref:uncharacterized protein LOC114580718 n=1 Tax=Dendrobium catenatum TaxID=906689 RepID=UPI0010A021B6|nr:uncharacterized protein LOC114580718 [Dendrobium catenatum]
MLVDCLDASATTTITRPVLQGLFGELDISSIGLKLWISERMLLAGVKMQRGGKSTLENCQVLQATVNRFKGNKTEISKSDLIQKSAYCRVSGRDLDLVELSAYGNVRRAQDSGGCNIQ